MAVKRPLDFIPKCCGWVTVCRGRRWRGKLGDLRSRPSFLPKSMKPMVAPAQP
jgi:hypothetical protein